MGFVQGYGEVEHARIELSVNLVVLGRARYVKAALKRTVGHFVETEVGIANAVRGFADAGNTSSILICSLWSFT
jgi:hypothetical protein